MKRAVVVAALLVAAVATWFALRGPAAPACAPDELLVVEAFTDKPLAGVTVGFLPRDLETYFDSSDMLAVTEKRGRPFQSDASGRVKLPAFQYDAMVGARSGALHGSAYLRSGQGPWRLELHRPIPVTALVLDGDGKPCADVGVLLAQDETGRGGGPIGRPTVTDADGTAHFADVADSLSPHAKRTWLTVALPFARPPSATFDMRDRLAAPLKIVLPPSGRVRCEVVDEDGAPVADGRQVVLRLGSNLRANDYDERRETRPTVSGVAVFPRVGLGTRLEVEVPSADEWHVDARLAFDGPAGAADETRVRVTIGGRRPTAVGRLVDAKGAPLAGMGVSAELVSAEGDRIGFRSLTDRTTDEHGRFRLPIDRPPGDSASMKLEVWRRVSTGRTSHRMWQVALVALPATLPAGEFDLGDVACSEE